jgi:hypothetical protein
MTDMEDENIIANVDVALETCHSSSLYGGLSLLKHS